MRTGEGYHHRRKQTWKDKEGVTKDTGMGSVVRWDRTAIVNYTLAVRERARSTDYKNQTKLVRYIPVSMLIWHDCCSLPNDGLLFFFYILITHVQPTVA